MSFFNRRWAKITLGLIVVVLAAGTAGWWWYVHRLGEPVSQAQNSLPVGVVGCWALYDGESRRAGRSFYQSPSVVKLDATPDTSAYFYGSGIVRRAVRLDSLRNPMDTVSTPSGPDPRRFTYWAADSTADRLRIRFSSGFSGTQFLFELPESGIAGDTISGRAISFWDYRYFNTAEGSAYAVRVFCPK